VKLHIVAVGAVKERATRALIDEYLGRLKRYGSCDELEIKPGRSEEKAIRKAVGNTTMVALDVTGEQMSSKKLARRVERLALRGKGDISFVIGGATGLPKGILADAHERWSLSQLTFPHRLARLILAEQLYRAMTILRGEPYDK
jgi:23S rRNA (pseudouridine1915-N3)-methyltransferase